MSNQEKRVIITGGTGMIGLALIRYLLKEDAKILVITHKNSKNNQLIPKSDKIKMIEESLENIQNLQNQDDDYDVMYNLAWDGTRGSDRTDVERQERNIKYTLNAVNMAKNFGCKTFIGSGSQAEYGLVKGEITEDTPTNPKEAYGLAKLTAGNMSRLLANKLDIKHIWVRIFSVYGLYDKADTMVMNSIKSMLDGKSPKYTKGEQLWDFVYCDDVSRALDLISKKGREDSIYCIGSGKQKMLKEYVEIIKNEIDPRIQLELGAIPYSKNQVMNLSVKIDKLREEIGFQPEIDFEEGIKRTIKWYKEEYKI